MPEGIKGFQEGHPGYKKPGTKNRDTLIKEERRAIFDKIVSQDWEQTIALLRPEYKADQFLGKAPEESTITIIKESPIPDDELALIKESIKKRKLE